MLFIYTAMLKVTINEKKVNPLDICLIRTFVMLVGTFIIAKCMSASFNVDP